MAVRRIKVAIISLTSCEGCQFAILDLGQEFLALSEKIEISKFRLVEEKSAQRADPPLGGYDLAFIEGSPLLKKNYRELKNLRQRTKFLVVLGNCAHTGGVYALRNYINKEKVAKYVYPETFKFVFNPIVEEISKVVNVDAVLPGCPITGEEFLKFCDYFLSRRRWHIAQKPVCYECQLFQKVDCLLNKGLPCLGPVILGGCNAVCPAASMPCQGCRGFLKDANWQNMSKALTGKVAKKELDKILEIFHIKK